MEAIRAHEETNERVRYRLQPKERREKENLRESHKLYKAAMFSKFFGRWLRFSPLVVDFFGTLLSPESTGSEPRINWLCGRRRLYKISSTSSPREGSFRTGSRKNMGLGKMLRRAR